jgi:5-methylcytosine-specific restriction enzyme B
MSGALEVLATEISRGLKARENVMKSLIEGLFGERYQKRHWSTTCARDAYKLADTGESGVPYAGLIHPDNPPAGPYGGTSVVWFPGEDGSLIDFGVGTRGLAPDEGVLTRPGHKRRIAALRRFLTKRGIDSWSKPDPAALGTKVPKTVRERFPGFENVFERYGAELYICARVPSDPSEARAVVGAFLDLYAYERGWEVLKSAKPEFDAFHELLRSELFVQPSVESIGTLLNKRRFVILQGPPGTGKTRMAEEVRRVSFAGRGMTIQFHPAVAYEDFVVGLSPDAQDKNLRFAVREGWLAEAARRSADGPFLLVIDEINRADLGKVLGEAIYLFEVGEVGGERARRVRLPHPLNGSTEFSLPENLYVLATMNTADRSIASMDLAIRRRFAFVNMPPDRDVISQRGISLATEIFDWISDVFVEHAPSQALDLLPGHSYFLADTEGELFDRLRYDLIPLLDDYLQQGFLGPASTELHAVRDRIEDRIGAGFATN